MQFLQEKKAIINIRKNFISLDNREYEIGIGTCLTDENDLVILKKSKNFAVKKNDFINEKLINRMKQKTRT